MFATIYTDASGGFANNKQIYGYSYYVKCDKGVTSGKGLIEACEDINHAEMFAIVEGVKNALKKFSTINRVLVVTDSISAQYGLWQGSRKAKYQNIINEFRSLENSVEKIMIKWTKGHRGDNSDRAYLNNKCDQNANDTVRDAIREEKKKMGEAPKKCDICKIKIKSVYYDAKTKMGPWAYLCQKCFNELGVGLGIGKGQKYTIGENK